MTRLLILVFAVCSITSCSQNDANEITLVCDGIQTTATDDSKIKDDSLKVKRTIHLSYQSIESKSGIQIIHSDGKVEGNKVINSKNDWILQVDESRKIFDESYKEKILGKLYENSSMLTVSKNRITALQEQRNTFELATDIALNRYEKYSIDIDRISGFFREMNIEGPIGNAKGTIYRIETKGECQKSSRKF